MKGTTRDFNNLSLKDPEYDHNGPMTSYLPAAKSRPSTANTDNHTIEPVQRSMGEFLDPVHTGPDPYGHHINLKSLKTSMTLKFVIILQNLIKAYHRKSGKGKYDHKLTELDVETTRIRSRVNGVLM